MYVFSGMTITTITCLPTWHHPPEAEGGVAEAVTPTLLIIIVMKIITITTAMIITTTAEATTTHTMATKISRGRGEGEELGEESAEPQVKPGAAALSRQEAASDSLSAEDRGRPEVNEKCRQVCSIFIFDFKIE